MKTKQTKADRQLDKDIENAFYRLGSDVEINVMDISSIFRECRAAVKAGRTIDPIMSECIARYRQN